MDCPDCSGSGKIASNPYREAPPMKQERTPKLPPWYKRIHKEQVYKWLMRGVIGSMVIAILGVGAHIIIQADHEQQLKGYVLAQYDDKGQVVRCWVYQDSVRPPIKLTDHSATAEVSNRRDIEGLIKTGKSLGIENMQMCDGAGR